MSLKSWFHSDMMAVSPREKLLSGLLAVLAILAVTAISRAVLDPSGTVAVSFSMGAAVVLVCAVPHSPLSQPWPLVGGHLVSALAGVAMYRWVPDITVAAALAVGLAIVLMYFLHCLHPPGGAAALAAVLGGPAVHELGWAYVLVPVGLNTLILLVAAIIMNNIAPGRRYPQGGDMEPAPELLPVRLMPEMEDILAALHERDIYLDVSPEDLQTLYRTILMQAGKRRLGEVACSDIMSPDPLSLSPMMEIAAAREALLGAGVKSAPVVDGEGQLQGMISLEDLAGIEDGSLVSVMSTPVTTVGEDWHIIDALPLFTEQGRHHLPVLDRGGKRVVGMLTRSDLLRALAVIMI